jgi:hypothetical protein
VDKLFQLPKEEPIFSFLASSVFGRGWKTLALQNSVEGTDNDEDEQTPILLALEKRLDESRIAA